MQRFSRYGKFFANFTPQNSIEPRRHGSRPRNAPRVVPYVLLLQWLCFSHAILLGNVAVDVVDNIQIDPAGCIDGAGAAAVTLVDNSYGNHCADRDVKLTTQNMGLNESKCLDLICICRNVVISPRLSLPWISLT